MGKLFKSVAGAGAPLEWAYGAKRTLRTLKRGKDAKPEGTFSRMTRQQKLDKKARDAAKTPMHEDSLYS